MIFFDFDAVDEVDWNSTKTSKDFWKRESELLERDRYAHSRSEIDFLVHFDRSCSPKQGHASGASIKSRTCFFILDITLRLSTAF